MKNVLVFAASNSKNSINKKLVTWASTQLNDVEINLIDLNDFEMPIYSIDRENEDGVPGLAKRFKDVLVNSDGIMISFAEHNGSYTTAFKNIFDWMSRLEKPIWSDKPMFLMSTSPGGRGGKGVLSQALNSFPHQGAEVTSSFSLPSFNQNFNESEGIISVELREKFESELEKFTAYIMQHEVQD